MDPYRLMKWLRVPDVLMVGLAVLLTACFENARAEDTKLDPSNHKILGIDIVQCRTHDIYSKFGPSIPIREDALRLCYASYRDDTLVIFSFRGSRCFRFQLMQQKKKFNKWHFCAKTPVVSGNLATDSGIKLGIDRTRLKKILGPPLSETSRIQRYVFELKQKIKTDDMESQIADDQTGASHRRTKAVIRAEFSETGLISFDFLKLTQY